MTDHSTIRPEPFLILLPTTAIIQAITPSQVVLVARLPRTIMTAALWQRTKISLEGTLWSDSANWKAGAGVGVLNHVALYVIINAHDAKQNGTMNGSTIDTATEMRDYRVTVRCRDLSSTEAIHGNKYCQMLGLTQGAILSHIVSMSERVGAHYRMLEMIGRPYLKNL